MRPAKLKPILGVLILVLSAAGLYFWETCGREELLTEDVLTAACEISAGETIERSMLVSKAYLRENVARGSLLAGEEALAVGLRAKVDVPCGMQLNKAVLAAPGEPEGDMSCFAIDVDALAHLSPSIRAGDMVEFYSEDVSERLGTYRVAYVRNDKGQPVTELDGKERSNFFKRGESTGEIAEIEIITDAEDYGRLVSYMREVGSFVVVQIRETEGEN
jgi:hypothetical protein